jgi:hypothetical protein
MAELHSNLYFSHPDTAIHAQLKELFLSLDNGQHRAAQVAEKINPDNGEAVTQSLFQDLSERYPESIDPETLVDESGFWIAHLVSGGSGDHLCGRIVRYLHDLVPGIRVQAWGCGDDDPWEYWYKMDGDNLIRLDDEPYEDDDARIFGTIYRWWHETMPENIREGFLHEDDEENLEGEVVSDSEYARWLRTLKENSSKDPEPPLATDEIKDLVSGITEVFSLFSGIDKANREPDQESFKAEIVVEELILRAYDDLLECTDNRDVKGVLKHYSKKLTGKVTGKTDNMGGDKEFTYRLYEMMLIFSFKSGDSFNTKSKVRSVTINADGSATLLSNTESEFTDPATSKDLRMLSDDQLVWKIIDGDLLITEFSNKITDVIEV